MKNLESKIYNSLIDKDINSAEESLSIYGKVHFCDEKIDDGIDDEDSEDEYLMMQSYYLVTSDDNTHYIRIYFGDNTRIISYIQIS